MTPVLTISFDGGSSPFTTEIYFAESAEIEHTLLEKASLCVFDQNTRKLFEKSDLVLPAGEEHKNWRSVETILKKAVELGLGRDSVIAGAGGGVVCDITAFASSLYMRGCGLLLVPTSLLAMVDAAAGGKTGIDFGGYKNMVGTFYPAARILISIDYLLSLPERELRCGLAEVIKSAMLDDSDLLTLLEEEREGVFRRDGDLMKELVSRSLQVKARYVESDYREGGIRAHLNLGHTFGHALESVSGFTGISHGEAVAWGILRALDAGIKTGNTDPEYGKRIEALIRAYGFSPRFEQASVQGGTSGITPESIFDAMNQDKKKRAGDLRFILQRKACATYIESLEKELVLEVVERGLI